MPITAFRSDPLVRLMRRRINDGYYTATPIPSERCLASESGLSLTCVRRAAAQLIEEGVLERNGNGRLRPSKGNGSDNKKPMQALLLSPVTGGISAHHWQEGVFQGVSRCGGLLRVNHFLDEDDPALLAALGQNYDLMFLIPPDRLSEVLRNRLRQCADRLFTLYRDLTGEGLSLISDVRAEALVELLEHLRSLGHRTIDCVHCHRGYREYEKRIEIWKEFLKQHNLRGQLWDCGDSPETGEQRKVASFMRGVLRDGRTNATALLGLSVITGWGVARAAADAQLDIPGDLSLAVFGPAEHAALTVPSITSLQQPAISEMIRRAIECSRESSLENVETIEPDRVNLYRGESTAAPSTG